MIYHAIAYKFKAIDIYLNQACDDS